MSSDTSERPLLELRDIGKVFASRRSFLDWFGGRRVESAAVAEVNLALRPGEVLGLVGESGSGKSTVAQIAVRLMQPTTGQVVHEGNDVTDASGARLEAFRRSVQIVFQDTGSSLNPRKTVGRAVMEALRLAGVPRGERRAEAVRLLELVGLSPAALRRYPHQLSGGQRQRIGITRALAMRPRLLIADEPVSSLDVSLQAQIVELLIDLQRRLGLAMLFITHDLALAGQISDRIAVMYRGRIVEQGRPEEVLLRPLHPYTKALLDSVPKGFRPRREVTREVTQSAAGFSPEGDVSAVGCPYAPRCGQAMPICSRVVPPAVVTSGMHLVRCHLPIPELAPPRV